MTDTQEVVNELEQDEAQKVIKSTEGPLKQMLVEYVGSVLRPDDGQVTVEMIVQTLASEFPEFLLVVARENWIRGYEQALNDVENVEKERKQAVEEKLEKKKSKKKKSKKKDDE
tara:strand:- start:2333 stop:2674 length:342 start_codon:yes stop_codon:yes gene_type:complete